MLFIIHKSWLYYNNTDTILNDYYQTIVSLLKSILTQHADLSINIIFGNDIYNFNNTNKTIRINFNYEHTLVKQGGRGAHNAPIGSIKDDTNVPYLVRIDRYDELNKADIIIDYSMPNIYNVAVSNIFQEFSKKHIYISPSIYDTYHIKENRNINTLTTFVNIHEPRRYTLLETIKYMDINHINVNNCFDKNALQTLYKNTKILINIHQTDHHHTFEEFRVLPALQCGVLVICEESPLSHLIPYNDYIIWASYDSIHAKVMEVLDSYDEYYDSIFVKEKMIKLDELHTANYTTMEKSILDQSLN